MDANQLLMGGGIASARFDTPGATVTGAIVREPEARQQTDYKTGTPVTWPSGEPKMQVIVHVQTTLRDPSDPSPSDDGIRAIYIKGKSLTEAVREAVRAVGARGLAVGGTLTVTYTGDGQKEGNLNPAKLYTAQYVAPNAANNVLMATAPVDVAAPAGVDPGVWERMAPEQRQTVLAAMGQPPF